MNVTRVASLLLGVLYAAVVRGETLAVVIGVNDVPKFRLNDGTAPRSLRGAEQDARLVADVLKSVYQIPNPNVRLLLGREARLQTVREELQRLARQARPEDIVLLHFSGHGTQRPDAQPYDEADDLDEAICLYDAQADGAGLLLDDELGRLLEAIPAGDVIVVLDCCHAGTGVKDDDGIVPRYLPYAGPRNAAGDTGQRPWRELQPVTKSVAHRTTAFFACRPEQQAYERRMPGTTERVGQFSHFFWTGLRDGSADADRNGSVSRREAIDYAARQLDETFNRGRTEHASRQTPIWEGERPDLPLFLSPATDSPERAE